MEISKQHMTYATHTNNRNLNVVSRPVAMQYYSILNCGFEFKIYITTMTHIKCWQVYGCIYYPEGDHIVEQICETN